MPQTWPEPEELTETERLIIVGVRQGKPLAEIAVQLGIAVADVASRVARILGEGTGSAGDGERAAEAVIGEPLSIDTAPADSPASVSEPALAVRRERPWGAVAGSVILAGIAAAGLWMVATEGGGDGAEDEAPVAQNVRPRWWTGDYPPSPMDELLRLDASIRAPLPDTTAEADSGSME